MVSLIFLNTLILVFALLSVSQLIWQYKYKKANRHNNVTRLLSNYSY